MKKNVITIIVSLLIICSLVAGVYFIQKSKSIPDNAPETLGNTSGNLNNEGLFCESDGYIYFANVYDNHYLYKMKSDGTEIERLMDVPVAYINAGGDYLYFYYADQGEAKFMGVSGNMRGIYRLEKSGDSELVCIERTTSGIVNLIGSELYYQHYDNVDGMTLYSASINGKDRKQMVKAIINPACVMYGNIYYPNQENYFYLNQYTPGASSGHLYVEEQMYNPTCVGDNIYYLKVDDNYKLYRFNMSSRTIEKITDDRVDAFNVYGDTVFYQRNLHPALIKVNSDGSGAITIAEGNYKNINCTPTYTFFQPFEDDNTMYYTQTIGGGSYAEFIPQ